MKPTRPPSRFVLHDDSLIEANSPTVRVTNGAIRHGHGVFETIPVYQGRPFAATAHLDRLAFGADRLGLALPMPDVLRERIGRICEANDLETEEIARVRITILPSDGPDLAPHCFVEATPYHRVSPTAKVITIPFARNELSALAGVKTISYGENVVATRLAQIAGADEAVFANTRGNLCEGTWSNLFVRIAGRWITPPVSSGCLPGVTRALLLELGESIGVSISKEDLAMESFHDIEAGFLTSSLREIQQITMIDNQPVGHEFDGEIQSLRRAFREVIETGRE